MTRDDAEALVRKLEVRAAADPGGYRVSVGLLALAGYGYIALMLLVVVGLLALLWLAVSSRVSGILVKLSLPILLVLWAVLRALWVRLEPPTNVPVSRTDAPALWDEVERIRRQMGAPVVHEIQIDGTFNAAILQHPRLGIFGWQRNYLLLGLPLLQGLSTEQVTAVIAHELGHLSGHHSRFAAWIYRLRQTWAQLLGRLEEENSALGQVLFTPFFAWYSPYFSAYSFVLARADEYIADRCSAEVAGPTAARSALTRIAGAARYLDRHHWPAIARRVSSVPEPPADVPAMAGASLQAGATELALSGLVEEALAEPTDFGDTHPSLADRLRGLDWTAPPDPSWSAPPPVGRDAASQLLGGSGARFAEALGAEWRDRNRAAWSDRHRQLRRMAEEAAALESAAPLDADRGWRLIGLIDELEPARVHALTASFVIDHPDHADGRFAYGRQLLDRGDDTGISHLQAAARLDDDFQLPAHRVIAAHLTATGHEEDGKHFERLADEREALIASAVAERKAVPRDMILEPSGLPEAVLSDLRQAIVGQTDAVEVYLARRLVTIMPEKPCYLLAVKPRRRFGRPVIDEPALMQAINDAAHWPRTTYSVAIVGENAWLRAKLRALDTLLIEQ